MRDGFFAKLKVFRWLELTKDAVIKQEQTDGSVATVGAAELSVLDVAKKYVDLTAESTLTALQTGSVFFLNSATEFATTLPAPAAGLKFKFIVKAAPSGAAYTIVTASSANIMIGGINELEVDTADDGPYIANGDSISFADGVAVVGDYVELESDGTSWYFHGQAKADGGIVLAST